MKIVQINMVHNSSTGKIMIQIARTAREKGYEAHTFSVPGFSVRHPEARPEIPGHTYLGTPFEHGLHYVLGKNLGLNGYFSVFTTAALIRRLKIIQPDIIHLHNIHNWCLNLPMLMSYVKKSGAKVVWTLHDCWSFTGQCPYFDMVQCERWKTGCHDCPQCGAYPESRVDHSAMMYRKKQKWFLNMKDATLVTPSNWLADLARQSFMGCYPVKVIHNGIDLEVFRPVESDFRAKYGLEDKIVLLGVAFGWGKRKGLDVFLELAGRLDEKYRIVLVGTSEELDSRLPANIISIHNTDNQQQLAQIYTAADILLNPTREENFPTVNLEAMACGTPVITFRTGGSPEMLDETSGMVVAKNDIDGMLQAIDAVLADPDITPESCRKRAMDFDMNHRFAEYVSLYENLMGKDCR